MMHLPDTLWTVGHSTRTLEAFLEVLRAWDIGRVADVRRYPSSRRYPQFNRGPLETALGEAGIEYLPFSDLGGMRKPHSNSRNTAWTNDGFRAYADYMETVPFRQALKQLLAHAVMHPTAVLCAEALWWRCHRALIADLLKVMGVRVVHILDEKRTEEHPFTKAARIREGKLSYTE